MASSGWVKASSVWSVWYKDYAKKGFGLVSSSGVYEVVLKSDGSKPTVWKRGQVDSLEEAKEIVDEEFELIGEY